MFVFGLGTVPMLVATHETVGWLRNQIGRLRLRQLNGAIMVLSGLAVVFIPIAMKSMHGNHDMSNMSGDNMQMSDSQMTDMPHNMGDSTMNHEGMSDMDHDMHNMNNSNSN